MENTSSQTSYSLWKFIKNKYVIIIAIFVVWMFFFDMNSILAHKKISDELSETHHKIKYYSEKFIQDSIAYNKLKHNRKEREKYARENYYMKKKNEDIFIIVHQKDTIQ